MARKEKPRRVRERPWERQAALLLVPRACRATAPAELQELLRDEGAQDRKSFRCVDGYAATYASMVCYMPCLAYHSMLDRPQWAHQGRRAQYKGSRKNQFDGRRHAAVSHLQVAARDEEEHRLAS